MRTIIKNIGYIYGILDAEKATEGPLKGAEMAKTGSIRDAFLVIEDDEIKSYGSMSDVEQTAFDNEVDAQGGYVLPAFIDSHTHLVFAETREREFEQRIEGATYQEIASAGGGILNSAKKLGEMSEDELYEGASRRLNQLIKNGVGGIEIKSGYGLTVESELKMLRVIARLKKDFPVPIKATFLGAHALSADFRGKKDAYMDLVCGAMLDKVSDEGLADYIDIFCEDGYFDVDDTRKVIEAGESKGLKAKIHVNQFNAIGGVKLAVDKEILSIDHLEELPDEEIEMLRESEVIPVALPSCSFFLNIPYTPARKLIDSGQTLVLASDYNPGSTPSGNMWFLWSLACIKMKMTPIEALNALTINAAYALELQEDHGSITVGKKANLIITKPVSSLAYIPYSFGESNIDRVLISGKLY